MTRGGSRSQPPKALAQRASLEPARAVSDYQKPERCLTAKTVAFRVLAGLGEARLRSGNSMDFAASDALGRLIDAIRMTPPLRALEEVLRPT
jgi:hypothetical protein